MQKKGILIGAVATKETIEFVFKKESAHEEKIVYIISDLRQLWLIIL